MEESLFNRQFRACMRALLAAGNGHEWDHRSQRCFLCGKDIWTYVSEESPEVCPNGNKGCRPELSR